jgi:formylglycine-generating enzyme required for sulfatase activity
MSKQRITRIVAIALATLTWTGPAHAGPPKDPPTRCAPDAVLAGPVCVDKYEASVWRIPDPLDTNKGLVKKVRKGKAVEADLIAAGATQLGTASDNYAPCADNGQNCANDIYAVSLSAVTPAAYITWFQALEACLNSGKRLPSNAEWQAAASGSPDSGTDNGTTDCKTVSPSMAVPTGTRTLCVSSPGAYDMVGNLFELVADWVPMPTACPGWGAFSDDTHCFAGADTAGTDGPAVLTRGGSFGFEGNPSASGPLTLVLYPPKDPDNVLGFRCAR